MTQWNQWNLDNPGMTVPMQPAQSEGGGKCTFTYLPTGSQRDFRDAIWIKRWNGLGKTTAEGLQPADYLNWNNQTDPNSWLRLEPGQTWLVDFAERGKPVTLEPGTYELNIMYYEKFYDSKDFVFWAQTDFLRSDPVTTEIAEQAVIP